MAGGRGKGTFSSGLQGGVKLSRKYDFAIAIQLYQSLQPSLMLFLSSFDEIPSIVDQMIGHSLVTKQTGKDGVLVRKVFENGNDKF